MRAILQCDGWQKVVEITENTLKKGYVEVMGNNPVPVFLEGSKVPPGEIVAHAVKFRVVDRSKYPPVFVYEP